VLRKGYILVILSIAVLFFPTNIDALTVSQIEKKLLEAQSEEDVEKVILEIVKSKEYQKACQLLFDKINSLPPPEKTQAYLDKVLPILQDYETLNCRFTENYWGDPPDPPEQYSQIQCNELISEFEVQNKKYLKSHRDTILIAHEKTISPTPPEFYSSNKTVEELKIEYHKYCLPIEEEECKSMKEELDSVYANYRLLYTGSYEEQLSALDFGFVSREFDLVCNFKSTLMQYYEDREKYQNIPIPTVISSSGIICGKGTIENEKGQCVPNPKYVQEKQSSKGGCLIATATYGSELSPQVQQLRELRDSILLETNSGSAFMTGFNHFYYSFSPTIADWERQNSVFKEVVMLTITPLITSLSLLNYVNMDSEAEVLGYGIGLIVLNVGMYVIAPVGIVVLVRRKF